MLPLLLALPPLSAQSAPQIAFVARFYGPSENKTPSRVGVYVCDQDGRNRQTVVIPDRWKPYAVAWAGPTRLVWLCLDGSGIGQIWTSPWPNPRPVLLESYKNVSAQASQPGHPYLSYESGGTAEWLTVTPDGTLTPTPPPVDPYGVVGQVVTSRDGIHEFRALDDGVCELSDGQGAVKQLLSNFSDARWDPAHDRLWVRSRTRTATSGTSYGLYTVDWGGMRLTPRVASFAQADFWPGRDLMAFCLPPSKTKLGKMQVWVGSMFVGNVRTGKFDKVVSGSVHVSCVAVQPE